MKNFTMRDEEFICENCNNLVKQLKNDYPNNLSRVLIDEANNEGKELGAVELCYKMKEIVEENGVVLDGNIKNISYNTMLEIIKNTNGIGLMTKEYIQNELENNEIIKLETSTPNFFA